MYRPGLRSMAAASVLVENLAAQPTDFLMSATVYFYLLNK